MNRTFDAEPILRQLAEIRRVIPYLQPGPPPPPSRTVPCTPEDFEYAAVADGVESLLHELEAAIDHAYALATAKALEIYYTAEELSRQPEHAELIPHVARMREAWEEEHGRPIPEREAR
ncbi:MAG TPA: hypothetical protein VNI54_03005 [Thermoanaerobaculia bacterium]|nr:hypothetical protein [Thermoanaerobaculia bacterium]